MGELCLLSTSINNIFYATDRKTSSSNEKSPRMESKADEEKKTKPIDKRHRPTCFIIHFIIA